MLFGILGINIIISFNFAIQYYEKPAHTNSQIYTIHKNLVETIYALQIDM